jgi:hypothetical protein
MIRKIMKPDIAIQFFLNFVTKRPISHLAKRWLTRIPSRAPAMTSVIKCTPSTTLDRAIITAQIRRKFLYTGDVSDAAKATVVWDEGKE